MACSAPDCDESSYCKGLCAFHYWRQRKGVPLDQPRGKRRRRKKDREPCDYPGCAKPKAYKKWCRTHYERERHGAPMGGRRNHQYEDFVEVAESGCYGWTGRVDTQGYPVFGRNVRATRYAWELHNGPIPDGLEVCHHCDNPPCTNPDHLWLGTKQDNQLDKKNKGRQTRGEAVNTAKLTEKDVLDILSSTERVTVLAARYGVSRQSIHAIYSGKSWRHMTSQED